jgi:predicted  nucleic acid-binding Zn-ribbon protein
MSEALFAREMAPSRAFLLVITSPPALTHDACGPLLFTRGSESTLSAMDAAIRRLDAAIDTLEAAVNRGVEHGRRREALESQLQAFGSDRSRLASELDRVRARSTDLEAANREVSRRLEHATDTIRAALSTQDR